jgi:HK97 family phage major capsid protein
MAEKTIKQLNEEARALLMEAKAIRDKGDGATPEEREAMATKSASAQVIVERLEKFTGANEENALKTINRIENSLAALNQPDRPYLGGAPGTDGVGTDRRGAVKSLGESFISDPAVADWLKRIAPGGRVPDQSQVQSPVISVKSIITTSGDITSGRPLLGQADRQNRVVELGWTPLTLMSLISVIQTQKDAIEVPREKSRTLRAAIVPEADPNDIDGISGLKPLSDFDLEIITANVKSIAHGVAATTRILDDSDQLRGRIDLNIRNGIAQERERLILHGDPIANSDEWTGLYATLGQLTQPFDTDILRTSRRAKTRLMAEGLVMPTAYLMNPYDWEQYDLYQDLNGRYYFGGPLVQGTPRIWGVPVVESLYAAQGVPVLGRFSDAVLYDRQQTNVQVFTQHSNWARRNLVLVQGEERAAFLVERPRSFCTFPMGA